jgi:hypothetical protein
LFGEIVGELSAARPDGEEEPMINVVMWEHDGDSRVLVFPRTRHRPSHFYAEGEARVLISPAAVDCGGVMITPLEHDFARMTGPLVEEILGEVLVR